MTKNYKKLIFKIVCVAVFLLHLNVNSQTWETTGTAGFSATASYQSMAIDVSDTPYVAYQDIENSGKTTVMKFNGTAWGLVGTAGFSAGASDFQSMAVDASGTPFVAFRDFGNSSKTTVMKFDGTAWVLVGTAGFSAGEATSQSLVIDASGTPYVAYRDVANSDKTTVMKFDGTAWVLVGTAGFSAGASSYQSLAIDASGTPYVAYGDGGNSTKTTVMKFDGTAWVLVGTAGFSAGIAYYQSLVIDASGTPYVAYKDNGNNGLTTVMKFDGTSWVVVGAAGFPSTCVAQCFSERQSLVIDASGTLYVAYRDWDATTVMKFDGTSWVVVGTADFSAGNSNYQSMVIDASGTLYVAYVDYVNSSKTTVMQFQVTPKTVTASASEITSSSAVLGGNITSNNGNAVTERGIVYSLKVTNSNPQINGTGVTQIEDGTGIGTFDETINGLTSGAQYSYSAYATNIKGTSYGAVKTFTTLDTTKPVITVCAAIPANIIADASCQGTMPDLTGGVTATDNSGLAPVITQSPVAGTTLYPGTTLITITATDGSGNTATCTVNQTVVDSTKPSVTCPGNQIETPDSAGNFTLYDYTGLITATDNCTGAPTVTQSPAAGTVLTQTTTITITATDGSGNTDTCTFDVVLPDTTAPVFENNTPLSATITDTGFTLNTDIDEGGTIYYIVVADEATAPTSAEVKAGTGSGGSGQVTSGSAVVSSGDFTNAFSIAGLTGNTAYDVYAVAQDDHGTPNLQASPTKVDVTTQTGFVVVESGGATSTNENGTTDTFTVALISQPNSNVVIDLSSGDLTEGTVDKSTLTFTTANWDTAQTVTVTGLDDGLRDGNPSYDITLSINAALTDDAFDGAANKTVSVTNFDNEITAATAGADQNLCGASTSLGGNTFSAGESGTWSIISGTGGAFVDTNNPTSSFSGAANTAYTLRWTIDNGGVSESTDDVVITLFDNPTAAAAGPDQSNISGTATLAANTISGLNTTGTWTQVAGPGIVSFGDVNSNISTAIVTVIGNYTFRWTSSNGVCPISTDDVAIEYTAIAPIVTNSAATSITGNEAQISGNVSSDGSSTITQRGFVYALTSNDATPTVAEVNGTTVRKVVSTGTIGDYNETLTGLVSSSEYAYIAYATNGAGTSESATQTFTTLASIGFTTTTSNVSEGNGSGGTSTAFDLDVDLSGASSSTVTVNYSATFSGTPVAGGVLSYAPGETTKSIPIGPLPTDDILKINQTVIVTLSSPTNSVLGSDVVHTTTVVDDDTATVAFDYNVSANEDTGAQVFTATLDKAVDGGFTIDVNTVDGTATVADGDYTAVTGETLTFAGTAGETQSFSVTPTSDTKLEANEALTINMNNLGNTTFTTTEINISSVATYILENNDTASVTIADVSGNEDDGAITLTATLDNAVQGGFTVDVSTVDGTATTADSDYTAVISQTLAFTGTAGETQTFTVTPTADTMYEPNETLTITQSDLAATTLAVVITDGATVTINDDDIIPATITFADINKTYGDANFNLGATTNSTGTITYSVVGSANGTSLSGINNTAVALGNVGTITIRATLPADGAYSSATKDITLAIGKAELTATADDVSREYGDANPIFTIRYTGFKGSDTAADLDTAPTVSSTATTTTNVGTVEITVTGGSDSNYTIATAKGILTIGKATLIVTAKNTTVEYGDNFSIGFEYGAFKNGEDASVLDTGAYVYIIGSAPYNAGTYSIVPDAVDDNNYKPTYVNGTLTVEKATVTGTADDKTKVFGEANPIFTISYTGFKGADDAADLDTAPVASSTATTGTPAGNVNIDLSTGTDTNYTINSVNGTLTILADTDGDGNPDTIDTDDDNDGILDVDDNSPLIPNKDQKDTDGDGLADVEEDCDNDGIINYYDTDVASCQEGIVMKKKYGFSPNGDGINDTWVVEDIQLFPNNVVHIYNRSGKLVYTMKGYDNSFNGFSNKVSSGRKLPVGAYYFTVEFNTPGAKPAKGWIYINF